MRVSRTTRKKHNSIVFYPWLPYIRVLIFRMIKKLPSHIRNLIIRTRQPVSSDGLKNYDNYLKQDLHRKSHLDAGNIYFWTATIRQWQPLLSEDRYKEIIINSLDYFTNKGLADIFAFVIMPNHIHLIWRTNGLNGKESVQGSLLKYSAHCFRKLLLEEGGLEKFAISSSNKKHEFWQRDSLAVPLYSRSLANQKLDNIHNNPLSKKWKLANTPAGYKYSSARYYSLGEQDFPFLKNLWEVL